ncbi:MAG TPA: tetraacyldisaccharide 4'-kinase [Candidatus Angelobacter sp.]|nr:tetraacyldisaccharide 4'-kinase [Candidatus Angelobacter sp.]
MNPLSMLFGAGVAVRNVLYDRGTLKVQKLARPVVSIGNISIGGTGKTPFVIALGELLKQRGIAFDVLSRGYGRSSKELAVVDPLGSSQQFGDEPLLIARKLGAPVIVSADRFQAGQFAEKQFPSRLHLLDDGFQHRRLHRDFDIVLLPKEDFAGTLLPVGRLREPLSALRRADAIVAFDPLRIVSSKAQPWAARRVITRPDVSGKAVAFCAIGRPQQFVDAVKMYKQELTAEISFRDHHRYQQADIERLLRVKSETGADCFITTEKDLINLAGLAAQLQPLLTIELRIELEAPNQALDFLLDTIERRIGCRV